MKSNKIYQTEYNFTKGLDLASNVEDVDPARSPDAVNVIYGANSCLEKRPGYMTIRSFPSRLNGVFFFEADGLEMFIVHSGSEIYRWNEGAEPRLLMSGVSDSKSSAFTLGGKLYILTGKEYLYYDAVTIDHVKNIATVPIYMIACKPNGIGEYYQSPNILQAKRIVKFIADGISDRYRLPEEHIKEIVSVKVDGVECSEYSLDISTSTVSFYDKPAASKSGTDNVEIMYSVLVAQDTGKIERCRISTLYGIGNNDRAVLSGNPFLMGKDWTSELHDPTYFPYELESDVGDDNTPIMGYGKLGNNLCIAKKSAGGDSTIFFRTGNFINGRAVFSTKQSVVGVGMVCMGNMGSIDNEPLFLSEQGIYGIGTNSLTAESTVQNRTYFINPAIMAEKNLSEAVLVSLGNRLYVSVDDRMYVVDGSLGKSSVRGSGSDYVYEGFLWTDIPARILFTKNNKLYFGTEDGRLCVFKDISYGLARFNDDGKAISAHISTRADIDGSYSTFKQLERSGLYIRFKGYNYTGSVVKLKVDYEEPKEVYSFSKAGTDFSYIDFERFGFQRTSVMYTLNVRTRCKNYCSLQIILENSEVDEGFCPISIVKQYSYRRDIRTV